LYFVLELDEGDVVAAGDQANLFEAGELQKENEWCTLNTSLYKHDWLV
jgi:hypothetical protein